MKKRILTKFETAAERYSNLEILRPLVHLIPFGVGSAIDSLFGNRAAAVQVRRLRILFEGLKSEMETMQEAKIDKSFLESDEFYYHCKDIFSKVINCRTQEKIHIFRRLFLAGIVREKPDTDFLSLCTQLVSQLEIPDIMIIKAMSIPEPRWIRVDVSLNMQRTAFLQGKKPGEIKKFSDIGSISPGQFEAAAKKLLNLGLAGLSKTEAGLANYSEGHHIGATTLCREFVNVTLAPRE